MSAPWNGPTLEDAGREAGGGHSHAGHAPETLRCRDCGAQSDFTGTYSEPCAGPECPDTGEPRATCDCGDCYYARHGEPRSFRCCDGVGYHSADCEHNPRWNR